MLMLMLAAAVAGQPTAPQATGVRGAGEFVVVVRHEPAAVVVRSLQVMPSYSDSLSVEVFDGMGRLAGRATIPPGGSKRFSLRRGVYAVACSAGRNAMQVVGEGAAVFVDGRGRRTIGLYRYLQPLYFSVARPGVLRLRIYAEEPAELSIVAPDGTQVWREKIPDHTERVVEVAVKAKWAGPRRLWRLEGRLEGDVRITLAPTMVPLFADGPQAAEVMRALSVARAMAELDGRPAAFSALALAHKPEAVGAVRTKDGLAVELSGRGGIASCGVTAAKAAEPWPRGGFAVRDHTAGGGLSFGVGNVRIVEPGKRAQVSVAFGETPLRLRAGFAAEGERIVVRGTVESLAEGDRAVTVLVLLPVPQAKVWFDDVDTARRPTPGVSLANWVAAAGVGANGRVSQYPLGCVAGGPNLGDAGVAVGVPLDAPRVFRISYVPEPGIIAVAFDFGLTAATKKFPRRASFTVELFRTDAAWGFRDALRRYYAFHPDDFRREVPKVGGWVCWGNLARVPNFRDFGFQYHWGPGGADAVRYDEAHGVYSFLYNDSVRYFADLGAFEKRPTHQQAVDVFQRLLSAPDPRAFVLSRPPQATGRRRYESREKSMGRQAAEKWLKDSLAAARRSACIGPDGTYQVGYIINRKDWGPPNLNWWTGRLFCNPDPDVPDGWGRFLIERIITPSFKRYAQAGGRFDGVGLDNYFVYAHMLDCRREHFAYVDNPLCFDRATLKVGAVGDFLMYEWVQYLRRWLRSRDGWLIANLGHWPYPFAARLLDIHGFEWGVERSAAVARALAYHKPVVSLPVLEEHYLEPFIRAHVRFGFIPGGYATARFAARKGVRELYRKYVPALIACAEAGWEPVTYVRSDNEAVKVERFGRPGGRLLLTVTNASGQAQRVTLRADAARLGLKARRLETKDLISGKTVQWRAAGDQLRCAVQLGPEEAMVLQLSL